MNNNYKMRAYTHTLQMVTDEMPLPMEEINAKPYMVKKVKHTERGVLYPLNVNKYAGYDVEGLTELYAMLDEIRQDLYIDKWVLDRQDIAIDTGLPFDDLYKLNKMFVALFALYNGRTNVISIDDALTLKKRALTCTNRKYELYIYDKAAESNGKYPYSRCEFRFKLLDNTSRKRIFKRLYKTLDALPGLIDSLNKVKATALYNIWLAESSAGYKNTPIRTLPEFFRRYGNDIFTVDIAKSLHGKIANGTYKHWIDRFRENGNTIHFIKKCEIIAYCQSLKRAVKRYEKTPEIAPFSPPANEGESVGIFGTEKSQKIA